MLGDDSIISMQVPLSDAIDAVSHAAAAIGIILHYHTGQETVQVHVACELAKCDISFDFDNIITKLDVLTACTSQLTEIASKSNVNTYSLTTLLDHTENRFKLKKTKNGYDLTSDNSQVDPRHPTIVKEVGHVLKTLLSAMSDSHVQDYQIMNLEDFQPVESKYAYNTPTWTTLHDAVSSQARKTPKRIALQFNADTFVTYEQLEARSDRLADHLISIGISQDDIVPICMEKAVNAVVSMLAISKSGAAWVSLDPMMPQSRVQYIIDTTDAKIMLVDEESQATLSSMNISVKMLNPRAYSSAVRGYKPAERLMVPSSAPVYYIFTSGTSGKPKGVRVIHAGIVAMLEGVREIWSATEFQGRHLQFSSYTFDMSIWEIYITLAHGGCVCFAPSSVLRGDLQAYMQAVCITITILTPTVLKLLDPLQLPWLQTVSAAGEALTSSLIESWHSHVRLVNAYGLTETTVFNTYKQVSGSTPANNVGCVYGGNTAYLLGAAMQPLSVGCIGELYLGGPQVTAGFLKDEAKTKAAFKIFQKDLLYKTGDKVRLLPDGELEHHGRSDMQMKFNGLRIDPMEIEAAIAGPGTSAFVTVKVIDGKQYLTAFVEEQTLRKETCQIVNMKREARLHWIQAKHKACALRFATKYIPTLWIPMTKLPYKISGKIDSDILLRLLDDVLRDNAPKALQTLRGLDKSSVVHPRNDLERQMLSVWAQYLSLDPETISVFHSFGSLGGDSVTAMQIANAMHKRKITISSAQLTSEATIADVTSKHGSNNVEDIEGTIVRESFKLLTEVPSHQEDLDDAFPLTPMQEGMVSLSLSDDVLYMQKTVYSISASFRSETVQIAWKRLVQAHPTLRTVISLSPGGELFQKILKSHEQACDWTIVTCKSRAEQEQVVASISPGHFQLDKVNVTPHLIVCSGHASILVVCIHHTLFDGWSLSQLQGHLEELLSSPTSTSSDPDRIRQLQATYVRNSREKPKQTSLDFWKDYLSNVIPFDYPTPPDRVWADLKTTSSFVVEWQGNLDQFCRSRDATPSDVVRAALSIVLSQHSQSNDVVFAVVNAGRSHPLAADVDGPCVLTLPFRVSIENQQSINDLLQNLVRQKVRMTGHEEIPLRDIIAQAKIAPGRRLFRIILAMQYLPVNAAKNLQIQDMEMAMDHAIGLQVFPTRLGLRFVVNVDGLSIMHEDAEILVRHILNTLDFILANPSKLIEEVIMTSTEEEEFMHNTLIAPLERQITSTLHDTFAGIVARYPKKIAVHAMGNFLTYQELDTRATNFASFLQRRLRDDAAIPILMEKSIDAVTAMLGVLKTGHAYICLDARDPLPRIQQQMADLNASILVHSPAFTQLLRGAAQECIQAVPELFNQRYSSRRFSNLADQESVAYYVSTSGSTGRPKCAMLLHRNVLSHVSNASEVYGITWKSRLMQFSSYTFDVSMADIYNALCTGACLCFNLQESMLGKLYETLDGMQITDVHFTPSVAQLLLERQREEQPFRTVQRITVSGEALTKPVRNFLAKQVRLVNHYGPAETAVGVTAEVLVDTDCPFVSIGTAFGQNKTFVVKPDSNDLVPFGVPGELIIAGQQVGTGYFGMPEKTASVFFPNPFKPDETMYRTGDLVVMHAGGRLEFLQRLSGDSQVKINGQRVEIGEVESALKKTGNDLAVLAVPNGDQKQLAAFVVVDKDDEFRLVDADSTILRLLAAIRRVAVEKLASHMIPSYWLPVSCLPITNNGKRNTKAMLSMFTELHQSELNKYTGTGTTDQQAIPTSETAKTMVPIWQKLLGLDYFTPDMMLSSYVALGGDSIAAIRLVSRMRDIGYELSLKELIERPSIATLSEWLDSRSGETEETKELAPFSLLPAGGLEEVSKQAPTLSSDDIEDAYPTAGLQQTLVMAAFGDSSALWTQSVFDTLEAFDKERFLAAWNQVLGLHPVLRTVFFPASNANIQVIISQAKFAKLHPVEITTTTSSSDLESAIKQYILVDSTRGLQPGGAACRLALFSIDENPTKIVISMHHSIYDGAALGVFYNDLMLAYNLKPLTKPALKYSTYIDWLLKTDSLSELAYWKTHLVDASPLQYPRGPSGYHPESHGILRLPWASADLGRFSAKHELKVTTLFRTALSLVLGLHADTSDVLFLETMSKRHATRYDFADQIGTFISILPRRVRWDGSTSLTDLAKTIQKDEEATIGFAMADIPTIGRHCGLPTGLELTSVLLTINLQKEQDYLEKCHLKKISDSMPLSNPLALDINATDDGYDMVWQYDETLLSRAAVNWVAKHLNNCLDEMVEGCEEIQALSYMDKQEILEQKQPPCGAIADPVNDNIVDAFRQRATLCPAKIAIQTSSDEYLTYAQVDELSSHFAAMLLEAGEITSNIIPICLSKSWQAIIAMIAIHKLGCAFVCIDANNPIDRNVYICKAVAASHIVCPADHELLHHLPDIKSGMPVLRARYDLKSCPTKTINGAMPAYLVFTSGTTGKPKGVIVTHGNFVGFLRNHRDVYEITDRSRTLQFVNYTFDTCLNDIFRTLIKGGCLCIATMDEMLTDIATVIVHFSITHVEVTTTVARLVDAERLQTLQTLTLGGEAADESAINKFVQVGVRVVNDYGPTETVLGCIARVFTKEDYKPGMPITIGFPTGDTVVYILSSGSKLRPLGAYGEICISGPTVSLGYLDNSSATDKVFVPDPYRPGHRMYRTGDLGCWTPDGILCAGRLDMQVKRHGLRIELGEIEGAIIDNKGIQDVILEFISNGGSDALVAFVTFTYKTATPDAHHIQHIDVADSHFGFVSSTIKNLSQMLPSRLPPYMIPSHIIPMHRIPLTSNGKSDRRALRAYFGSLAADTLASLAVATYESSDERPATRLEELLASAWADILGIKVAAIGRQTSFFRLGGDSISSIRLVAVLRRHKLGLSVAQVVAHPTIELQAKVIKDLSDAKTQVRNDVPYGNLPLSPIQSIYLDHTPDHHTGFNQAMLLRAEKVLQVSELRLAFEKLQMHHDMFRARFNKTDGVWEQKVVEGPVNIPMAIANCESKADLQDQIDKVLMLLDPSKCVLSLGVFTINGQQLMFVAVHHLVMDLVSWRIVLEDLENLLLKNNIQYEKTQSFRQWSKELSVRPLVTPKVETCYGSFCSGDVTQSLIKNFSQSTSSIKFEMSDLDKVNTKYGSSALHTLLVAFANGLAGAFQTDRFSIDIEEHGREPWKDGQDISRTVGWFTDIQTIDSKFLGKDLMTQVLMVKDEITLKAHRLLKGPIRSQVAFNYQGRFQQLEGEANFFKPWEDPEISWKEGDGLMRPMYLMEVQVIGTSIGFDFVVEYDSTMIEKLRVDAMLSRWGATMDEFTAVESSSERVLTICDLPLLRLNHSLYEHFFDKFLASQGVAIDKVENVLPCLPLQESLALTYLRNNQAYMGRSVIMLPGINDKGRVKQALTLLIERHEILRTEIAILPPEMRMESFVGDRIYALQVVLKRVSDHVNLGNMVIPPPRFDIELHDNNCKVICYAHHALSDAWSTSNLIGELENLLLRPNLPLSDAGRFSDVVRQALLDGSDRANREYWTRQLDGSKAIKYPRSKPDEKEAALATSHCYGSAGLQFPPDIHRAAVLSAAWAVVLGRHANTDDVIFGHVLSGRTIEVENIEHILGPCLNTVPCRIPIDNGKCITSWLREVEEQHQLSQQRQHFRFSTLRDSSGNPLRLGNYAATTFNFNNVIKSSTTPVFYECEAEDNTDVPLSMRVSLVSDTVLEIDLAFATDRLTPTEAELLMEHFKAAANSICNGLEKQVADVDIYSARDDIIWKSLAEPTNLSGELQSIESLFNQQVFKNPKKMAIQFDNTIFLTYEQVDQLANSVAFELTCANVPPESIIPTFLDKGPWAPIAYLGILRHGSAFCPLSPDAPANRIQFVAKEVGATMVLTASHLLDKLRSCCSELAATVLDRLRPRKTHRSASVISLDALGYMIYTSGSTGLPKGVMIEHRQLSAFLENSRGLYQITGRSRVFQFANLIFDVSVGDIFGTLTSGACLCFAPQEQMLANLGDTIAAMNVTHMQLTPTVSSLIIESNTPMLQTLILGGEPLDQEKRKIWQPRVRLINAYGPTEATVDCICNEFAMYGDKSPAIGKPLGKTGVKIVNAKLVEQPADIVGELVIVGDVVARGYFKRPELNASTFITNEIGQRMYRTGDLARLHPSGYLECLGRRDTQLKLHGLRIEAGEVESIVQTLNDVKQAVLLLTTIENNRPELCLFIACGAFNDTHQFSQIKDRASALLSAALPAYMMPSIWYPMEDFPRTHTGKTDRRGLEAFLRKLPISSVRKFSTTSEIVAPETDAERVIARGWSHVLNMPLQEIGTRQSFTSVGGDSISAIMLSTWCRQRDLILRVHDIAAFPTIQQQAGLLREQTTALPRAIDAQPNEPFELNPVQKRFLTRVQGNVHHYNSSMLLLLQEQFVPAQVQAAISKIVDRHPMLRARFANEHGTWRQYVLADSRFELESYRLFTEANLNATIRRISSSLNIIKGPLIRAAYLTYSDKAYVFITAHHLVMDYVSWRVIFEDLETLLKGRRLQDSLSSTFKQWTESQYAYSKSLPPWKEEKIHKLYAEGRLSKKVIRQGAFVQSEHLVDAKTSTEILTTANISLRTEPIDILLASAALAFKDVFGLEALTVNLEGHGREQWSEDVDASQTVGWFTSIFPFTIEAPKALEAEDIYSVVSGLKDKRRLLPLKGVTYGVERYIAGNQALAQDPDVNFNFLGSFQQLEKSDRIFEQTNAFDLHEAADDLTVLYRMAVIVVVENGQLKLQVNYMKDLETACTIETLLSSWAESLKHVSDHLSALKQSPRITRTDLSLLMLSASEFEAIRQKIQAIGVSLPRIADIYPMTPMQEGFHMSTSATSLDTESTLYVIRSTYRLSQASTVEGVTSAITALINRHDILRTVHAIIGSSALQIVLRREYTADWLTIGVQKCHTDADVNAAVEEWKAFESIQPFAKNSPNIRFKVFIGPAIKMLGWAMHHSLTDAWSWSMLDHELNLIADGVHLPTAPPFSRFVAHLSQSADQEAITYWQSKLRGATSCAFPPRAVPGETYVASKELEIAHTFDLSPLRRRGLSAATLVCAAWSLVVSRTISRDDIVFGQIISGRNMDIHEISSIVGPTINTVALRTKIGNETVEEFLSAFHRDQVQLMKHSHANLRQVDLQASTTPAMLYTSLFNFKGTTATGGHLQEAPSSTPLITPEWAKDELNYALALSIELEPSKMSEADQLHLHVAFDSTVISQSEVRVLLRQLIRVVDTLLTKPTTGLPEVSLISADETRAIELWKSELAHASVVDWPPHHVIGKASQNHSKPPTVHLQGKILNALANFDRKIIVETAIALAIARHADSRSFVFVVSDCQEHSSNGPGSRIIMVNVDPNSSLLAQIQAVQETNTRINGFPSIDLPDILHHCNLPDSLTTVTFGSQASLPLNGKPVLNVEIQESGCIVSCPVLGDFEDDEASWFLDHVRAVFNQMVEDPTCTVKALQMVSEAERKVLLEEYGVSQDYKPHNYPRFLHQYVEDAAARYPRKIALRCGHSQFVTYEQLDSSANYVRDLLQDRGVDGMIPLVMNKSVEMIATLIGVLKAGCAFVPIDVELPPQRMGSIIVQTKASLALCDADNRASLARAAPALPIITVSPSAAHISKRSNTQIKESDLAYLIFTSGSTGEPKGVMIEHRNVASYIAGAIPRFGLCSSERTLFFSKYSFDAAIMEIFATLAVGATVHLEATATMLSSLAEVIHESQVTLASLTPTVVRLLSGIPLPFLHKLILFAEALPPSLIAEFWDDHMQLGNAYGPTETTVECLLHWFTDKDRSIVLDRPMGESRIYVVDDNLDLCPLGTVGQIVISGPQVSRGYLGKKELTAKSFCADPFNPGNRLYQSGDLGRFRSGGFFECLGRKDNQIKLHGLRIELAEIEAVLLTQSIVERVIVDVVNIRGQDRLTAFVVLRGESNGSGIVTLGKIDDQAKFVKLVAVCESTLPRYMIPGVWIPISTIPILPSSGKADRKSLKSFAKGLPDPTIRQLMGGKKVIKPAIPKKKANGTEKTAVRANGLDETASTIRKIWAEQLGMPEEQIDIYKDSFLGLGGDSISAMKVAARLKFVGLWISVNELLHRDRTISTFDKGAASTSSDREATIAKVWSEYLGIPVTDIDPIQDSFLSLGGDSISAMKVAAQLRSEGLQISVQELLRRDQTITALCGEPIARPSIDLEEAMVNAWSEYLGVAAVDINRHRDSFLSLGGDSISAMKVAGRMRTIGMSLSISELLRRTQTISSLCNSSKNASGNMLTQITQVLMDHLGLDQEEIDPENDSFLDLGGDSTIAMAVIRQLKSLGLQVEVPDLLLCDNTIADVFRKGRLSPMAHQLDLIPGHIGSDNVEEAFTCSNVQRYFLQQGAEAGNHLLQLIFDLKYVDISHLKDSLAEVCAENSILRTAFLPKTEETPCVQIIFKAANTIVSWTIESFESAVDQIRARDAFVVKCQNDGFRWGQIPLKVGAFSRKDGHTYVVLSIHHASYDGWTISLLVQQWNGKYHERFDSNRSSNTVKPAYIDYARWEAQNVGHDMFWRKKIAGFTVCNLTKDMPSLTLQGRTMSDIRQSYILRWPGGCANSYGTTIFSLLRLALACCLSKRLNSRKVVYSTLTSGRDSDFEGIEDVMGPCIQLAIPFAFEVEPMEAVSDAIDRIQTYDVEIAGKTNNSPAMLQLLDSLTLVFQNIPPGKSVDGQGVDLTKYQMTSKHTTVEGTTVEVFQEKDSLRLTCVSSDLNVSKELLEDFSNTLQLLKDAQGEAASIGDLLNYAFVQRSP